MENKNDKAAGLLSSGHFAIDAYGSYITPLLPFIASKLNITVAIISLIFSISHLMASIMQPVFGHIGIVLRKDFSFFGE
jgi:MFS family permease